MLMIPQPGNGWKKKWTLSDLFANVEPPIWESVLEHNSWQKYWVGEPSKQTEWKWA